MFLTRNPKFNLRLTGARPSPGTATVERVNGFEIFHATSMVHLAAPKNGRTPSPFK
jgi:hypothetical protein